MIRGTNILVINPYEEDHRDAIIKSVETSKMDIQITTEDSNIIVTLGAIPKDVKNEVLQSTKKVFDRFKDNLKGIRQSITNEIKRLEKIISKDETKRIEKNLLNDLDK
jgi:ribosome recycling factor